MAFKVVQEFVMHQMREGIKLSEKIEDENSPVLGVYFVGQIYKHTSVNKAAADEAIERGWAELAG